MKQELGCKVLYQKSHLVEPRQIKTEDDLRPGTKKGKLDRSPIWIVEIQMPKTVAFDMYRGYMSKLKNEGESSIEQGGGTPPPAGVGGIPGGAGAPPPAPAGGPAPMAGPAPGGAPV
jgi:hypothetical protein